MPEPAAPSPIDAVLIGAIYADEDDIDADLRGFLPPGVALRTEHYPSLPPHHDTVEWARWMAASPGIEAAAERLAPLGPGAVIFPINSFSAVDGPAGAADISRRIAGSAGAPAATTSEAMVAAAQALGLGRIAITVPYGPVIAGAVRGCFEAVGIDVVATRELDLPNANNWEALLLPDATIVSMVRDADRADADGIYVGCTSLRTAHLVETLEAAVGKPVITANAATVWRGLQLLGEGTPLPGRGALFRA